MSLWSFLRGLWPWRKRPQPVQPSRPESEAEPEAASVEDAAPASPPSEPASPEPSPGEPALSEAAPVEVVEPVETAPEPAAAEHEEPVPEEAGEEEDEEDHRDEDQEPEEDEDGGWEDEDGEDPDVPDPFITGGLVEEAAVDADLAERRAEARATALSGEQRIYLSMPAGPGSLAEALEQLAAEGLVAAEFVSEGEDGPHILYRPAP